MKAIQNNDRLHIFFVIEKGYITVIAWSLSFNSSASSMVTLQRQKENLLIRSRYSIFTNTFTKFYPLLFCQCEVWVDVDQTKRCRSTEGLLGNQQTHATRFLHYDARNRTSGGTDPHTWTPKIICLNEILSSRAVIIQRSSKSEMWTSGDLQISYIHQWQNIWKCGLLSI